MHRPGRSRNRHCRYLSGHLWAAWLWVGPGPGPGPGLLWLKGCLRRPFTPPLVHLLPLLIFFSLFLTYSSFLPLCFKKKKNRKWGIRRVSGSEKEVWVLTLARSSSLWSLTSAWFLCGGLFHSETLDSTLVWVSVHSDELAPTIYGISPPPFSLPPFRVGTIYVHFPNWWRLKPLLGEFG